MYSQLFSLNKKDFINGAVNAVVAGIVIGLAGVVSQSGFDVFSTNWGDVLKLVINSAFAAFVGSLGKNLITTDQGKVLGMKVK